MPDAQAPRRFTQPPDSFFTYADFAQVTRTADEVYVQFYTTVPGVPVEAGKIAEVVTRLSATIVVSPGHARRLADALMKGAEGHQSGAGKLPAEEKP
jgi:hypothetical protein